MFKEKDGFIGDSFAQKQLLEEAVIVAKRNATVLLTGESGTGKELLARYIHVNSNRRDKPYVTCDCSSLSPSILESELFGFRRGAFTGALTDSRGYMRSSHKGTLFLDEIAELDIRAQTRLLRFLEDKTVVPIGSVEPLKIDTRIVAATNRDIEGMIKNGAFREDLFFRLNIINLHIEPLRKRKEDLLPLAEHFRRVFALKHNIKAVGFTPEAIKILVSYYWPGNVRELRNAVERAVILSRGTWIDSCDFPENVFRNKEDDNGEDERSCSFSFEERTKRFQRRILRETLDAVKGNRREAARRLDLTSHQIKYLIHKLSPIVT